MARLSDDYRDRLQQKEFEAYLASEERKQMLYRERLRNGGPEHARPHRAERIGPVHQVPSTIGQLLTVIDDIGDPELDDPELDGYGEEEADG